MREKNVKTCIYWGKLAYGTNPFTVKQVDKLNTEYQTYSQKEKNKAADACF
jgi:hypothetical protein